MLMIYFIGGPPRCGKTTLAKHVSKALGIPWISCDTLEVMSGAYMTKVEWKKKHPYSVLRRKYKGNDAFYARLTSSEIVRVLKAQALSTSLAIDMMTICEIKDGNDYVIEGYHVTPKLVRDLQKKYGKKNLKAIFLTKTDAAKFAIDVHKSTTPNDWLLASTKKKETFLTIGKMVSLYSRFFAREAKKYGFSVLSMDENFAQQLEKAVVIFRS